jgi:hypothetical protein
VSRSLIKTLVLLIEVQRRVHDALSITPGERDEIDIHQAEKKVAESRRALLPGGRMIAIVLRKIRAGTAPQAVRFSDVGATGRDLIDAAVAAPE